MSHHTTIEKSTFWPQTVSGQQNLSSCSSSGWNAVTNIWLMYKFGQTQISPGRRLSAKGSGDSAGVQGKVFGLTAMVTFRSLPTMSLFLLAQWTLLSAKQFPIAPGCCFTVNVKRFMRHRYGSFVAFLLFCSFFRFPMPYKEQRIHDERLFPS